MGVIVQFHKMRKEFALDGAKQAKVDNRYCRDRFLQYRKKGDGVFNLEGIGQF